MGSCFVLIAVLVIPGLVTAYFLKSPVWIFIVPVGLIMILCGVAALPSKRKATPQEWADELEKHLLGTEGEWDWDDATSVSFADSRLENLRSRVVPEFNDLSTPEKREAFRQIIEALRRGEIP